MIKNDKMTIFQDCSGSISLTILWDAGSITDKRRGQTTQKKVIFDENNTYQKIYLQTKFKDLPMRKDDQAANNKRKRTQKAVLALPADLEENIAQCDRLRNYLGEVRFARLTQELRYWSVLDKDTASEKGDIFSLAPLVKSSLKPRFTYALEIW